MTDLEITRLCAEAMEPEFGSVGSSDTWAYSGVWDGVDAGKKTRSVRNTYDPLHDGAQAMALVKRFQMLVRWDGGVHGWTAGVWYEGSKGQPIWMDWTDQDLNRAICECVAKMQAAKNEADRRFGQPHYGHERSPDVQT